MTLLTRDSILAINDLPTETVEVPEWGGAVLVRSLNGAERATLEAETSRFQKGDLSGLPKLRARVAVWCVVDDRNQRLFTEKDVDGLAAKHPDPLDRIFNAVKVLSGLDKDGKEKAAKKSSGQSNDSGTT
jgi:hypothetical protein